MSASVTSPLRVRVSYVAHFTSRLRSAIGPSWNGESTGLVTRLRSSPRGATDATARAVLACELGREAERTVRVAGFERRLRRGEPGEIESARAALIRDLVVLGVQVV